MDITTYLRGSVNYVYYFSAGFSIIFNVLLIYLVTSEPRIQVGVYKRLMVIMSLFEIFYSILDAFLIPIHFSQASAIVELVDVTDRLLPRPLVNIIHFVYTAFFGAFLALLSLHFIFRWFVVTEHRLITTFNSWKLFLWLLIPSLTGFIYSFLAVCLCGPNQKTSDFLRDGVFSAFGKDIDEFDYLAMYLFEENQNGEIILHMESIISIAVTLITIARSPFCAQSSFYIQIPSFFSIIFFGVKSYRRIMNLVRMTNSQKYQSLQSQLFFALVAQTFIPVVLMHIPVTILLVLAFTGVNLGKYGVIISTSITLYPAIDPLPTFFIVKPFRRTIIDFLTCKNIKITFKATRSTAPATLNNQRH